MKTILNYIRPLFLFVLIAFSACEGRREFDDIIETGVNLNNYDIILLESGNSLDVTAIFEPNVAPQRDYIWEVDDPSVADLVQNEDKSVTLTATGSGETVLSITAADDETITATASVKVIAGPPVDITDQSTISVNRENSNGPTGGEGSPKLIDNDTSTKYLSGFVTPFWVNLEFEEPIVAGYYSFTSGNDAPGRDPKDWEIQGSQDGENWTTLDSRTNMSFSDRTQTREFYFDNNTAYKFYRFNVLSNGGSSLFQMSEWRLFLLPF
ncbi:discoidin domain-containing protein [Leeuwenhoekiella polynyae]|uniref:F5/8 type C domain-containing protein n=1 Tax=Leeuwenhoekiella polynyae TaxID=1550906 RepID=A0A4V1KRN6_9FLAO|nr:discoidin domain-containing protein [Leeuwenhoekiella polynyae]RXG25542.1 F5/8 type C domain-containing protein [Leeuwenhoekiella polynyae]